MGDATFEPFCCPVQGCNNNGQSRKFGDAKHFYLHWYSTHKPRCPRTDCKFSLKDLSKTTESYFSRHWATHFPELKSEQSACDKCGRHFANANNRDRHVARCTSGTSGDDRIVAEETGHEFDLDAALDAVGATAPENDPFDWSGLMGDQGPSGTLLSEGMSFLNEFALPSVCMVEPSSMTTVAPPISTRHDAVSTVNLDFGYTMVGQTSASSLPHDPFSLHVQGPRVVELEEELANNFSGANLDHMFDPNMFEVTTGADAAASNPRKRLWGGETTQREKRHQTVVIDADHSNASFNLLDPHRRDADPEEIWLSREMEGSMTQGSSFPLESTVPGQHQSKALSFQITDDHDYPLSHSTVSGSLPLRIRRVYTQKTWTRTVSKQQSRCVRRSKQLIAVKSCIRTATGHQQISYDHWIWVQKVVHRSRSTTDTTSFLVNNVLVSKKTRFPRIIDDDAAVFQLCAIGQYDEVNRLLTQGDASIVDVNSRGETLLHIAVSHWQVEICRLLLAKGADIDAREWLYGCTPLGSACASAHEQGVGGQAATVNLSRNDFVNTLRLLVESGMDVCISVEVDGDAFSLADALGYSNVPMLKKRKIIGGLSWLFRKYIQATTCDGALPIDGLHPVACQTISCSLILDGASSIWSLERSENHLFTRKDTLAFQPYWLYELALATEDNEPLHEFSHEFCRIYSGDFHYQLPLEIRGQTIETSPMELALGSFAALESFHRILLATGVDVDEFVKVECTMPWCHLTQQSLKGFLSLELESYWEYKWIFWSCHGCCFAFTDEPLQDWDTVVESVKSGTPLDILLYGLEEKLWPLRRHCGVCERRYLNSIDEASQPGSEIDINESLDFCDMNPEPGFRSDGRMLTVDGDQFEDGGNSESSGEESVGADSTDEDLYSSIS